MDVAVAAGGIADRPLAECTEGEPGKGDQHDEDDEAHRVDVVGELLAGDDSPATGEPLGRRWSVADCRRRSGRQAPRRRSLSSVLP